MQPDLALARRFVERHPPPGPVLLLAVTGSHLYGFSSPDSDLDLKGVHLAPEGQILGLDPLVEAFDRLEVFDGTECDLTTHEAGRALGLLLKGNGNMIERIASPLQVFPGPQVDDLQRLLPGTLSTACIGHYRGFFKGCQREHARRPRRKSWLYSARVALTGVHLLETGEVLAHLPALADRYGMPVVHEVIDAKRRGGEKDVLDPDASAALEACWPDLARRLEQALAHTVLPDVPPGREALSDWLIHTRRRALGP